MATRGKEGAQKTTRSAEIIFASVTTVAAAFHMPARSLDPSDRVRACSGLQLKLKKKSPVKC